jgi:hypothetical protein
VREGNGALFHANTATDAEVLGDVRDFVGRLDLDTELACVGRALVSPTTDPTQNAHAPIFTTGHDYVDERWPCSVNYAIFEGKRG